MTEEPSKGQAADSAIGLRDEALAALDGGDAAAAHDLVSQGLAVLAAGGLSGADEAALLLAGAEIEEALGQFEAAHAQAARAADLLADDCPVGEDADDW